MLKRRNTLGGDRTHDFLLASTGRTYGRRQTRYPLRYKGMAKEVYVVVSPTIVWGVSPSIFGDGGFGFVIFVLFFLKKFTARGDRTLD